MLDEKCRFVSVYVYIHDRTYTEDFKKIIKYIKKRLISSTVIICKVDKEGKAKYILVDEKFLMV